MFTYVCVSGKRDIRTGTNETNKLQEPVAKHEEDGLKMDNTRNKKTETNEKLFEEEMKERRIFC
jgi:hypothetical protein